MVSVIIPVRGSARELDCQLESLACQSYSHPWELILVDNGSARDLNEIAVQWSPRLPTIKVVRALDRTGAYYARNAGCREASGSILLFCDADDVTSPQWIQSLVEGAADADLVAGAFDWTRRNGVGPKEPYTDKNLKTTLGFLPIASGGNFGINADVLNALGGWDEGYLGGGDIALAWRAQLAGYSLAFAPKARVWIRERHRLLELARQWFRFGMADAHLYAEFRAYGAKADPPRLIIGSWIRIVARIPGLIFSDERRRTWTQSVARRVGRILGSLKYRAFCL